MDQGNQFSEIRIFNGAGVDQFHGELEKIKAQQQIDLSNDLLFNPDLTQIIQPQIIIEPKHFETALDMVRYIHPIIRQIDLPDRFYNVGLWAWLSAFYFDEVCPMEKGRRKPGELWRHIPPANRDFRKYNRHLIASAVRLYDLHGDVLVAPLLYVRPHQKSELFRQITEVQELSMSGEILRAVRNLYWDEVKAHPKSGAASKGTDVPGSTRRFVALMNQFNLIYDLQAMNSEQILGLLPKREFERWLN